MRTEELIEILSASLRPMPRHAVERRLAMGLLAGASVTLVFVTLVLGIRPDIGRAMYGAPFWMKWLYTASLGIPSVILTARLARPTGDEGPWLDVLILPVFVLALIAALDFGRTPRADWMALWLGHSWASGPWLVLLLSIPPLIGLIWAYRSFAPARPHSAGAAAGVTAGALGATLYCLHCTEVSALFVVTWYSLGIVSAGALGMLLGSRVFRW